MSGHHLKCQYPWEPCTCPRTPVGEESEFKGQLRGHGLRHEGRVPTFFGLGTGPGQGRCSCGAKSPVLPTTTARQRWHRQHKAEAVTQPPITTLTSTEEEDRG